MKVKDIPYRRVSSEEIRSGMEDIISRILNAECAADVLSAREDCLALRREYKTASILSYIRYSQNTADEFYCGEHDYYDETDPEVEALNARYASAMLDSEFRPELEKSLSPLLFRSMDLQRRTVSPETVSDMIEENRLISEYSKLMSGMEFEFRGEKLTRPELLGYMKSADRETRKAAACALGSTMERHSTELDGIFDRLVHVRDTMAKKLGFESFTELGYCRMGRLCFGREDVEIFRKNVLADIVPLVSRVRLENAKRMGIERFMFYDNDIILSGGDPKPCGKEGIFAAAKEMYREMSPETGSFIDMMLENEAFDVDSRMNKWGGGYCENIPKYNQPFILANFNGTSADVDVVTHEAGHALNSWLTAGNRFSLELDAGGMETAETHSMSMEFFAWRYIDLFFGQEAPRYRYMHALDALSFIPYGTMVDAFQHLVYDRPDMSPSERNAVWLELEKKYRPHISFEGIPYLEKGTRWQYQMHIYEVPFYYIDYCLAQTAAFGFLLMSLENYDEAFSKYMRLSRQGGEKLWTELLEEAGIDSPFTAGSLSKLAEKVSLLLCSIAV